MLTYQYLNKWKTSNPANDFLFGSLSRERTEMLSLVLTSLDLDIADF